MLKISEMAKLANTTRRTLIFYDQINIFKPAQISNAGYRYYDYNQLYDLLFILGLRSLNISLDEIKLIRSDSPASTTSQLLNTQIKIDDKITELLRIKKVIRNRINIKNSINVNELYQPLIATRVTHVFWCSRQSVDCTEEEVAQLFSEFYKQLDYLTVMDTKHSGFLTNLSLDNPTGYMDASFRILKESSNDDNKVLMPLIEKEAGQYASILVENTTDGINLGLNKLKLFCQNKKIQTDDHLWQINSDDTLIENGASKYGWLEFRTISNTEKN
ncbi:MerR family transcriptional regulator [Weissella koreensis]|nr:MerR family transcriptional regulator [Weissella koreensis]MCZ9311707.1 MerR family transcriptional regulator [Weissella koreensis]